MLCGLDTRSQSSKVAFLTYDFISLVNLPTGDNRESVLKATTSLIEHYNDFSMFPESFRDSVQKAAIEYFTSLKTALESNETKVEIKFSLKIQESHTSLIPDLLNSIKPMIAEVDKKIKFITSPGFLASDLIINTEKCKVAFLRTFQKALENRNNSIVHH